MIFKNFTFQIVVHLCILILISMVSGINFYNHDFSAAFALSIISIVEIAIITYKFNRTNRSVAYFFESIENDDSQLRFSAKYRNKSLTHLYNSMNKVNEKLADIKFQNQRNEQYYKALIQQSATGLIAMSENNKIEVANTMACELAGIAVPQNFHRLQVKNPDLWNLLCEIKSGETQTVKIFRNGQYFHLSVCTTVMNFSGTSTKIISLQDIKQELDTKETESWQKLISVLTHEIMNSIAPITSLTNTLTRFFRNKNNPVAASEITDPVIENTLKGLDIIEERGNGLLNFVKNYRQLTKIPPPVFSYFEAYSWINNIRILLYEKLETHNIQMELSVNNQAGIIHADEKLLTQVIINLILNAIEALTEKPDDRKIKATIRMNEKKQVQIEISNNGPKIQPELADKIFVPFFTTKENGSGIGLSLSRQIIQMHRGYIYLETEEQETRFIIVL